MDYIFIAIIIALVFGWMMFRRSGVATISTEDLKRVLNDKDKVFIDVRTPNEYKDNHIKQFKNIPLGSDFSAVPIDQEIYVICQSGMRSSAACRQLKKLGAQKVYNVRGGMGAWRG